MSCVNPNDTLFKILLKSIKNPLLAEIEFDRQQDYKPGIEELFESNPELASIGTEEQYSQYLDSIFPDSKVKDIVYHGSSYGFKGENFDTSIMTNGRTQGDGVYFSTDRKAAERFAGISESMYEMFTAQEIQKYLKVAVVNAEKVINGNEVIVQPEQIHILGNEQDIEGFKDFVGKEEEVIGDVDRNDELDSYITGQLFTKLGITVPNKNNETLIPQGDVDNFNNAVAMNGNIQPSEYYTGINDVHKWRLNQKNLYDLVDKDTGDIYIKNVNLSKGVQENSEPSYSPINTIERDNMIDSINEAVNDYRLDEILAEKGYDVNDIISNLEAASTQEELNDIINKLLSKIC